MRSKIVNNATVRGRTVNSSHAVKKSGKQNTVRIIAGKWRGSKLSFVDADGLRPSGDRGREILFNWISPYIAGSRCLDLFAGSGSLALEALSRGAKAATAVDNNSAAIAMINAEAARLGANQLTAINTDALGWLKKISLSPAPAAFDIVFIDPPFNSDLASASITTLAESKILNDGAWVYIEAAKSSGLPAVPANWQLMKSKKMGAVAVGLFKVSTHLAD